MKKRFFLLLCIILLSGCSSFTPTARPTYTPYPTSTPYPVDPTILFTEDFSGDGSGWWIGGNTYAKAFINGGEYHYVEYKNDLMNWSVYAGKTFANGVMSVDFRTVSDVTKNSGSVFFWRAVDESNFYFMQVHSYGIYAIGKYVKNELIPIKDAAKSQYLIPGNKANKVTIVFNGEENELYFNGNYEAGFLDSSFNSGEIGLGVFTNKENDVEIAFDNLGVYRYDKGNTYTPVKPDVTAVPAGNAITWAQLADFLVRDHTNWKTYDLLTYNCLDFAIDLVENARNENIKAWIVGVDFTNGDTGHAFVAFETSDKGIVYIEPQRDYTYSTLAIGNNLCDDWGKDACWGVVKSIEYLGSCTHDHYCTEYTP